MSQTKLKAKAQKSFCIYLPKGQNAWESVSGVTYNPHAQPQCPHPYTESHNLYSACDDAPVGSLEGMALVESQGRQKGELLRLAVAPGCGGRLRASRVAQVWPVDSTCKTGGPWSLTSEPQPSSYVCSCGDLSTGPDSSSWSYTVGLWELIGVGRSLPVAEVPLLDFSGSLACVPAAWVQRSFQGGCRRGPLPWSVHLPGSAHSIDCWIAFQEWGLDTPNQFAKSQFPKWSIRWMTNLPWVEG